MSKVIRNNTSGAIRLTPNFFLSEFTDSDTAEREGIDNTPNPLAVQNLFKLAALMEQVRALLGNRVISVSSGFRGPTLNARVRGSANSDHLTGEACDFRVPAFGTPLQVAAAIAKSSIQFGQLIYEGTWVHISLPTRAHNGEVLTATFINGQVRYSQGLPT